MKKRANLGMILVLCLLMAPVSVRADGLEPGMSGYYTVHDEQGEVLLRLAGTVNVGDEYIARDNRRYRVSQVDAAAQRAAAVYVETVTLPEVTRAAAQEDWIPRVALYCTHTDESYIDGDGSESIAQGGGILDVAQLLTESLQAQGCEAVLDETNHVPHDAGAYRRSRRTAVALMKEEAPTLLLDIHRDAVPEDEYLEQVEGESVSAVRIVIGRGNANYPVNEELAKTVKAIADARYPGLIKDIYLGKGNYNQDLMARSLLLEFGSHETEKEMAEKSTAYLAEVLAVTLGAGETPQASAAPNASVAPGQSARPDATREAALPPISAEPPKDVGNSPWKGIGILALILLVVGGGILLFFVRPGERGASARHALREMTGLGPRPDPDRDERG